MYYVAMILHTHIVDTATREVCVYPHLASSKVFFTVFTLVTILLQCNASYNTGARDPETMAYTHPGLSANSKKGVFLSFLHL